MLAAYWTLMFAALILAHYLVLPQMAPAPLGEGPAAVGATGTRTFPAYATWSGAVAVFTLGAMLVSWFAWRRIGYLGTLFFMASAFIWAARWLVGEERTPQDSALYDARLVATLSGCMLGSLMAWLLTSLH